MYIYVYCYKTSRGDQGPPRAVELMMMMMMVMIFKDHHLHPIYNKRDDDTDDQWHTQEFCFGGGFNKFS